MSHWLTALALSVGIGCALPGLAEPITLDGLTFSDELGGVELKDGWGSGTLDDPFVLIEEITAQGPAILIIRGMTSHFGNRIRSHHEVGFALTKIVHNRTGQPWLLFNLELREWLDHPSPFGDGLSFGQATRAGRPFRSDRFSELVETFEPFDGLQFFEGRVEPGETVALTFVVTDTTPVSQFYLLQTSDSPIAARPAVRLAAVLDDRSRPAKAQADAPVRRRPAGAPPEGSGGWSGPRKRVARKAFVN
jgi:hypothetical protein